MQTSKTITKSKTLYRVSARDTGALFYDMRFIHLTFDTEKAAKARIASLLQAGHYREISIKALDFI
jgi:hypothetical protein